MTNRNTTSANQTNSASPNADWKEQLNELKNFVSKIEKTMDGNHQTKASNTGSDLSRWVGEQRAQMRS